jgi:hypothetical protein
MGGATSSLPDLPLPVPDCYLLGREDAAPPNAKQRVRYRVSPLPFVEEVCSIFRQIWYNE